MHRGMWLAFAIVLSNCGGESEREPEPVIVATTVGEETPQPEIEARSFGTDASSWMASIRDAAVNVMRGAQPPEHLPISHAQEGVPWVEMRHGVTAPTNVEAVLAFFIGLVTLSDGSRAEVVLFFTPGGPRLAGIDPRPQVSEHPPSDPYLEPIADLARSMLADFRLGRGAQHVVTVDELRALLNRTDLVDRVQNRLPSADDIAAVEQAVQQPGVELAHVAGDEIGVLMRDPTDGALYGVDLRFRTRDDGTHQFSGPPLLHVQRLPDQP